MELLVYANERIRDEKIWEMWLTLYPYMEVPLVQAKEKGKYVYKPPITEHISFQKYYDRVTKPRPKEQDLTPEKIEKFKRIAEKYRKVVR